ncbi:MAG: Cna B-type domain-containing protein [Lachnospiraceae bacterium]|nr:Cna B-type domain-containing protein [Lachnospiraceae bacterium]
MKKRRKTKLWKKVLVGFMSVTMFLGNLSNLSIEAFAATDDVLYGEEEAADITDAEPASPEVEELEPEVEQEPEEVVYYTVSYYDSEGTLIGSSEFAEGSGLSLPASDGVAYWTDADGVEYLEGDEVYDNLSLFAVVDDIDIEEETVEEDLPEDQVLVYAVLKDAEGGFIDEFRITEDMYLVPDEDNDAPVVDGYEFKSAQLDMSTVSEVLVDETEEGLLIYTVDGVELEADADIELVYESTAIDFNVSVEVVDEDGALIKGYETAELPEAIEGTLDLADAGNAPIEVEGYEYVKAAIGDETVYSVTIEPADAYYETDNGFVDIESDLLITLVYAESDVATNLTATIVDEFGDEIDEQYTAMELPEFDADGILVLDDPELPPVEDVKVKTGLFRSIKYTYVKAFIIDSMTSNNTVVSAIKAEEAADGIGTYYSYTTDGETWIKIKENTTVLFEYSDGKKTVYTYEDGYVRVTATLQHANAVPDDAYFAVTPLTEGSGYDVDTYIDALNAKADTPADSEDFKYTAENTLLYDIAFYTDETMTEEIEPADGMVKTEIAFLQNQLKDDLEADDKSELLINHLSLDEGVVEEAGTTANANVSVSSINVEPVAAEVSVAGESVAFSTEGYSVFTISSPSIGKKIKTEFTTADGAPVSSDKLPSAYLYVYKLDDQNQHALIALDGSVGSFENGVLTVDAESLKNDNLRSFTYGSDLSKSYGVEIWQLTSPDKASSANISSTYDMNNFVKRVYNTPYEERSGLVDMYEFEFPVDDLSSTSSDYVITARQVPVSAFTDAPSMLGEAAAFGVIADTYHSHADTQTNFAVKKFIGRGAGDVGATGADMANNPGTSYAGVIENVLQIKNNLGPSAVYYGDSFTQQSNGNQQLYYNSNGDLIIQDDSGKAHVASLPVDMINSKVDSLISGISVASGDMITLPTAADGLSAAPYYLDTTKLPSGTIHINLDESEGNGMSLYDIWSTSQKVYINKNSDQTIVFHSSRTAITLQQFNVCNDGSGNNYQRTETPATAGETNLRLADIANTIVFDFPSATSLEFGGESSSSVVGMFYAPNARAQWKTACAGWLICDYADGSDGEWHFIYQHVPEPDEPDDDEDTNTATLRFELTKHLIDDRTGGTADISLWPENGFSFRISKYLCNDDGDINASKLGVINRADLIPDLTGMDENGEMIVTIGRDQAETPVVVGTADFVGSEVWNSTEGVHEWYENGVLDHKYMAFMYKVEEIDPENPDYTIDTKPYYVKFFVNVTRTLEGNTVKYYACVDGPHIANTVSAGTQCRQIPLELTNHYLPKSETGVIRLTKRLEGKDSAENVKYSFRMFGQDNTRFPVSVHHADVVFTSSMGRNVEYTTAIEPINSQDREVFYFDLYADETISISGLPTFAPGHRTNGTAIPNEYTVQELGAQSDADEVYLEGTVNMQAATWNPTGYDLDVLTKDFHETLNAAITYVNVYYSKLTIEKSIVGYENLTDEQKRQITFTVTGPSFPDGTTVTYDQFTDGKYEFTRLERGDYTVRESGQNIDQEYICETTYSDNGTVTIDGDHPGTVTVTNKYTHNSTSVSGSKTWRDGNNQDGLRPGSITIRLMANGQAAPGVEPITVTPDELGNWSWTFDHLPKYDDKGKEITYTVTEDAVPGYTTTYSTDHLSVVNNHAPEITSVRVQKTWAGDEGNTEFRPSGITIDLLANGVVTATRTLNADNGWKCEFVNLPKKANGADIEYTINEVSVDRYETAVSGDAATGFTVTNTYTPEYVQIHGKKVWDDESDFDGSRPEQIVLHLYANGVEKYSKTVKASDYASDADEWAWDFNEYNLDKYIGGQEIAYTVTEDVLTGDYSTTYSQVTPDAAGHYDYENNSIVITNSYTPGKTNVSGSKTWNDDNNKDGKRPTSIEISLIKTVGATVSTYDTKTVTAADGWAWEWTGLPVKENNAPISWSIEEPEIPGYETVVSGYNVTNTHESEKVKISGVKTWIDANDQDGLRDTVTIGLYKGDEQIRTADATKANGWTWSFDNLDKYEAGKLISYNVRELTHITGYDITPDSARIDVTLTDATTEVKDLEFTNTHTPYVVNIRGTKVWVDNDNQDGIRPTTVSIELLANGKRVDTAEVPNVDGKWEFAFYNLPRKAGGVNIEYTVRETNVPAGYTVAYDQPGTSGEETCTITNTHTPKTIDISGGKTWVDADDQDGLRPDSITVRLLANGTEVADKTVEPDANGDWKYEFTDLPEKENGSKITYTVTEDAVAGYDSVVNGYNITNTHTPEKISISGGKSWNDNDNQDGLRPDSITLELYMNGQKTERSVTTSADNGWLWEFDNLDAYAGGEKIAYTVKEEPVEGYTTVPTDGFVATTSDREAADNLSELVFNNTHTPEKTRISVAKEWSDAENQDGKRPSAVTVNLLANGSITATATLSSSNNWQHTFDDLDKYLGGQEIVYSISESDVEGYTPTYVDSTDDEGYRVVTITNSYTPETTYVSAQKIWSDGENQDGSRPQQVTVILKANGEEIHRKSAYANTNWACSFTNLPKYSAGEEILYTIEEVSVEGYTSAITNVEGKTNEYIITNTHKPATISISGGKKWEDNNNQDGVRPQSITVKLNATNVAADERTTTATAPDYAWSFKDLPKYQNGVEILYVATEEQTGDLTANGYTLTDTTEASRDAAGNYQGIIFTNTHTPATVEISGSKNWDDNDNQDGIRPDSISVQLYADGQASGTPMTVRAGADNKWTWSFTDLPRFKDGKEISYTVEEILPEDLDYELTRTDAGKYDPATGNKTEIVFTNTHTPATMDIRGIKKWEDNNDQDGLRDTVTIILYKTVDGKKTKAGETTASADSNWEWKFENLPKMAAGELIHYEVEEINVPAGYTGGLTNAGQQDNNGNVVGVEFTNTHTPELTFIEGTKVWDDNHDQDGKRPVSIKLNLYQNNDLKVYRSQVLTPDDKTADSWSWRFDDLPKYSEGKLITYRVEEVAVTGYQAPEYSDDHKVITNKRVPELTEVRGTKVWNDAKNQDGKRPGSVTVHLYADGVDTGKSVTLTEETGWDFGFTELPKYKNGARIAYTVTEDEVEGYSTVITGDVNNVNPYFTITNSYTPGKVAVSGGKVWNDDDDKDGLRPDSITVRLLADGVEKDSVTALKSKGYAWAFTELPEYASGQKIEYTVTEDAVEGYETTITSAGTNQWTITNTHESEKIDLSGKKTWNDSSNRDGVRPASITVNLLADGKVVKSQNVSADENGKWEYTFTGLDKYRNHGTEIEYTVTEDPIVIPAGHNNQYQVAYDGMNITNTYDPETVNIHGSKTWDDAGNQDNVRPASITVQLKVNGTTSQEVEIPVAEDGSASWEFNDLPKYADGKEIEYTIAEQPVDKYVTTVSGYNLVNTHTPQLTDVEVVKDWKDFNDQDGIRPESISVQLKANGTPVEGKSVILSEANNWKYKFTDLPMFAAGSAIIYSVEETAVSGYDVSYAGEGTYKLIITNTHKPEYVGLTVRKNWIGGTASAGSVELSIEGRTADGSVVVPAETYKVSAPNWTLEITAASETLPKNYDGKPIQYYVTEVVPQDASYIQVDVNGAKYNGTVQATADASGNEFTADIYNLALTQITVLKQWENDPGYFGGNGYVDVTLLADGTAYKTAQVKASDDWTYTFTDLPVFNADGSKIVYTVDENTKLAEYNSANGGQPDIDTSQFAATGTIIIKNVLDPLTLTVNKQWLGDPAGTKHDDIQVRIMSSVPTSTTATTVFDRIRKVLGGGSDKWYEYATVTLGESNNWTYTVDNLPRYALVGNDVVKVSYAVEEPDVPEGYTSVTNVDGSTATVINTGYTSVAGFKTWDDGSNIAGYRPGSADFAALIGLYQDGKQFTNGTDATHFRWLDTTGDSWSFEFYDLPAGHTYTIGELARVLGYGEPVIDGYTIRNPLEFTQIGVTKIWDDADNAYSSRPASIAFRLLANGTQANIAGVTPIVTLDSTDGASYIWKNLPVNDRNGNRIAYNVEEVSVPAGYTENIRRDGDMFIVTNSFRPAETEIRVTKVWDDMNDAAGIRPTSIQVALTRNGADIETVTLSAANGWTHTWSGLPTILADGSGTRAEYSVREVTQILGYTVSISGSGEVYTITNYYRGTDTPPTPPDTPTEEEGTTRGGTRTSSTQPPYTIPDEPTPLAGLSEVLGARRAPNPSVLGARRSPQTGDASNAAAFVAAMASAGAMMGAWFSMRKRKKG